jgi:hypothetical protein
MSRILSWETDGVELICLCYLEAATPAQIRYAIRRIRRRIPDVSIIVASLGRPMSVEDDEASTAGAESVQDSLRATIDKVMAVRHRAERKLHWARRSPWSANAQQWPTIRICYVTREVPIMCRAT